MKLYFVHGLNGSATNWKLYIDYFTKRNFTCEAIELQKEIDVKTAHLNDYIIKVKALIKQDDVVIGHSMGGLIMQKLAEQIKMKAGIGLCPAPPKGINMTQIPWWRQLRYIPYLFTHKPFKPSFKLAKEVFLNGMEEQLQRSIYDQLQPQSVHVTLEVMKQKLAVDEHKISSPLLFIGRRNDHIIPVNVIKQMAKKYHAPYEIVEGNHYIYHNCKKIAERMHEFIKRI